MSYNYFNYFNLDISNSLMFYGTYDATHSYLTGDICIIDGYPHMYIGDNWECISINPCDDKDNKTIIPKIIYPTNCKNCGAILHNHICEYCGSDNKE